MTYKVMIDQLEAFVEQHHKSTFIVKYVVVELSGYAQSELYMKLNEEVETSLYEQIKHVIEAYVLEDTPVDYILGYRYFYGHKIFVNENVLIPRNETEELVEYILMYIDSKKKPLNVLDLGTGSGCIGLTLKKEAPQLRVILSDISPKALDIVNKNSINLGIGVTIKQSNWFSNIEGVYDIIVSNPPYIPDDEVVGDTVYKEPEVALYGGKSGLEHYETILSQIKPFIHRQTLIAFEHGYQQKKALHKLIHHYLDDVHVITKKDMQGRDRMTFILNKNQPFGF